MSRNDRGQLAGGEAIPFGLLIFVIGSLLITNAWAVIDAKFAVDAAAQAAARDFSETTEATYEAAIVHATTAGETAFMGYGRSANNVTIEAVDDRPDGDAVQRCDRIEFRATTAVPAISLPLLGGFGDGFSVTASHARTVDPLRSGLAGEATCI